MLEEAEYPQSLKYHLHEMGLFIKIFLQKVLVSLCHITYNQRKRF